MKRVLLERKCLTRGLRGFNGAVRRRLATLIVTMLYRRVDSCWVKLSFGAFSMSVNGKPTRVSHAFVKKNKVRYIRPHGRFTHHSCCIFTLAMRQPLVLASCIEIYYFWAGTRKKRHLNKKITVRSTLREILLVVLTKRSQLYIFSKRYQKFCKTYQYLKDDGTKYATNFFL